MAKAKNPWVYGRSPAPKDYHELSEIIKERRKPKVHSGLTFEDRVKQVINNGNGKLPQKP
jgi:hypothetical protein